MATRNFNVKNGLTAGNITLDATTNNITTTGNATAGNFIGRYANGNSNINIPAANGNIQVSVAGVANVITFANNNVFRGAYGLTGIVSQSNTAPSNPQNGDQWYNTFNGILFEYIDDGTSLQWVDISSIPLPNIAGSNASAVLNNVQSTGTYFPAFISSTANGNYALSSNTAFSANLANGAMIATTFVGALSGAATSATTAGTVTTAAQPNITSVGTLTSLGVNGTVTAVAFTANTGVFTGNANGLSSLQAGNLTGTVAQARLANSTLTLGNTTLTLGGTTTTVAGLTNVTSTQFTSNVATGTAPMVVSSTTKVANLNADLLDGYDSASTATAATIVLRTGDGSIIGNLIYGAGNNLSNIQGANVTGAVASATTAGTVTTAAQPNITSVGTLTSATVTGNVAAGNLTTTGVLSVTGTGVSSIAGNLDMTSNTIINLATPTNSTDAATKQYVDDVAQGLNIHDSVAAATSTTLATTTGGTITYNNGASGVGANLVTTGTFNLIDGVNVQTAGTRILVKNEANAVHNGIYTWSNATVITRATDYDSVPEVEAGDFVFVTGGTLYDNTGWVQTSTVAAIGTAGNNIDFTQFSGAGTYTAGTGLTLTGSAFSVNASQTQVTSVGTLGSLAVTGNANVGNLNATTAVVASTLTSNVATGTAPLTVTSTTRVNNLNVAQAGVADSINVAAGTGNNFIIFANAATGNIAELTSTGLLANLSNNSITATTFVGAVSGDISAGTNANASNISSGTLAQARLANASVTLGSTALTLGSTVTTVAGLSSVTSTTFVGSLSGAATSATTAGTVTTAAQPNITSVGTLSSLAVTANATANNFVATTFNLNTSNSVTIANGTAVTYAGQQGGRTFVSYDMNTYPALYESRFVNLSGSTNVPTNAGTGLGYWFGMGAGDVANRGFDLLGTSANTLFFRDHSLGNTAWVQLVSNVSGTAVSATTAGTVTTAAQPNITSVGTLTSATVTGNVTAGNVFANSGEVRGGNVRTNGYFFRSITTGVTATGTVQGDAAGFTSEIVEFSTVTAGSGARLPVAAGGMVITIVNTSANSLNVYPATGAAINSLATNAAYTHTAGATLQYIALDSTRWRTVGATYA